MFLDYSELMDNSLIRIIKGLHFNQALLPTPPSFVPKKRAFSSRVRHIPSLS